MKMDFFISSVDVSDEAITGISLQSVGHINITEALELERIWKAYYIQEVLSMTIPPAKKVKMTLEQVCKELRKDIEIVE